MTRKSLIGIAAILIVILVLIVYFFYRIPPEQIITVRIGYLNIVASLPLFIAEEKGFLEEEDIKYKSIPIASSNQLVDAIVAGNIDCFIESSAVPVLAVELQSPGKMKVFSVSEITMQTPFDALLVKKDSPIKDLFNLEEKKIGVFPGSTATNLLKKYLTDRSIDVSKILFIPMLPANHLLALLEGSVDVIHAYEPTIAIALSDGNVRKLYGSIYAEMLSPNPQGVAVMSTSFMQKDPKIAADIIRALERAMIFMKENDSKSRQILANRMKLSKEAVSRCVFLYMLPHQQINNIVFQRYADMLTELRELEDYVKIDDLIYH